MPATAPRQIRIRRGAQPFVPLSRRATVLWALRSMLRNQPSSHLQSARDGAMEAASLPNEGQFVPGSFLEKLNSLVKGIGCPNSNVGRAPHKAFDKRWASLPHPAPPPAEVLVTGSPPSSCSNGLPAVVLQPVSTQREPVTKPIVEASISSARGSRTAACPPLAP
ncbi:hypothetical protein G0U57_002224, partial [Chelydra serpentina]